jgi:two-component system chemotaxis response regulator CheY
LPHKIICRPSIHTGTLKEGWQVTNSVERSALTNSQKLTSNKESETRKYRIAVLDDNADIRHLLRVTLERDYLVEDFDNATALLEFLEETPCDRIISDLCLPNMDGFDFIFALRKNARHAGVPVVAYTASGSAQIRERVSAAGFAAYLEKPDP